MANKTIDQLTAKANPVDADLLVIADSQDNNEMKQITIGSITADIADGIVIDASASLTTTYSSTKIAADNATQDAALTAGLALKLNTNNQLRTGNGAWKVSHTNGSGNEVELALGTAGQVLTSSGATSAPTFTTPTADIVSLTEDTTGDMNADFALVYDNSAGANRKQKPNVYRASDAEAIAQSVNTKFVTPANLAAITSFNSLIQPVGYQELGTYVAADTWAPKYCTCLSDGFSSSNSIYVACSNGGSGYCTIFCFKFQDGFFYGVSSASSTATAGNATTLAAIGNYVYSWRTALQRFDKDTLANTTTITVSGTAMTNNTPIFAIGSDLYNVYTTGTAKKYTISGTTATSSTDVSYTSMGAASTDNTWSDGTYVYQQYTSGADLGVYRWAIAGGARTTLSTYKIRITSSTPTDVGTLKQSGKNILIRLLTQGNGTFNISPIPIT